MSKYYDYSDKWLADWFSVCGNSFLLAFFLMKISQEISFNLKIGRHWILHSIGSKLTIIYSSLHSAEKIYGKIMPRPVTWFIESLSPWSFAWHDSRLNIRIFSWTLYPNVLNYCFLTKFAKKQTLFKLFGKLYPRWRNWIEMHLESV